MRRVAVMLVLLLALGLCTSVLVAWAGALVDRSAWPDTLLTRNPSGTRTEMRGWLVEEGHDATLTWRTFVALDLHVEPPDLEASTALPAWSVGHGLADQPGPFAPARERTRDVAWEVSAGWPMRCVRATRTAGPADFALPGEFVRGGVAAMALEWPLAHDASAEADRPGVGAWPAGGLAAVVPLGAIPAGLFVNTLVLACAWGVALSPLVALRVLRRWRRRKKNRCPHCAHSVGGLPDGAPCTECGRDLRERTTIAELLTARAPMLGASLALVLVVGASASLLVHRWMAVDRLPPLHYAAAVGDVQQIERLVADGANIDAELQPAPGWHGSTEFTTALHWAAARGHAPAVDRLLDLGAHATPWNASDRPLHVAMLGRHEGIVGVLLAYQIGGGNWWPEAKPLAHTSRAIETMVIEVEQPGPHDLVEAGIEAVIACDVPLLDRLIDAGLDPGQWDAAEMSKFAIVLDGQAWRWDPPHDLGLTRALLERGVHPMRNQYDYEVATAIDHACLPCLEALVEFGAEPATDRLYEAVRSGDAGIVALLLAAGGSPEWQDDRGYTLLWYAALSLKPDVARVLLDAGADPTRRVGGMTVRGALTDRNAASLGTFWEVPPEQRAARPDEVAVVCDLLEAAEAQWAARERSAGDAGPSDGG